MSLSPITRPARRRRFKVYDFEWYPETMRCRLAGVYDGERYQAWHSDPRRTVEDFLNAELTEENAGVTYFAHAGGLTDFQFVLDRIYHPDEAHGYSIEMAFSGSSAIIVKISQDRKVWTFADSFWLLKDKLETIAKSIGRKKLNDYFCTNYPSCGHKPKHCVFYAPIPILKNYNEEDNRILYDAIAKLEEDLIGLGGELKSTIASCAMRLFRGKFLKQEIPTHPKVNRIARLAYCSSRVEVLSHVLEGPANGLDFNSSFPWSMTKPQPGFFLGAYRKWKEEDATAIVRAEVEVPPMHIPPLPYRSFKLVRDKRTGREVPKGGRAYFPVGRWWGWFNGNDLQFLLRTGGRIRQVSQCLRFLNFDDLAAYVEVLYDMRKKETDPFRRLLLKYLLNSCYGKFGEGAVKQALFIRKKLPRGVKPADVTRLGPHTYLFERYLMVPHEHVPIAVNVTASSRMLLGESMLEVERKAKNHYVDCDSLWAKVSAEGRFAQDELPLLPTEPNQAEKYAIVDETTLGRLKVEKEVKQYAIFVAPKFYIVDGKVKAKGFSRDGGLSASDFRLLCKGGKIDTHRMLRIRETVRSGDVSPREETIPKGLLSRERPKRRTLSDGLNTAPWTIEELAQPWTKREQQETAERIGSLAERYMRESGHE